MKFFMFLMFFAAILPLFGKTVQFRSGEILAAEYSSTKPAISNWNNNLFSRNSAANYVAVAVKLHPKRKISIYDYALLLNGRNYSCVAIRTNGGAFTFTQNALSGDKGEIFTLLFFADGDIDSSSSTALVSLLPPNKYQAEYFKLSSADGALLPFNSIKKGGNF